MSRRDIIPKDIREAVDRLRGDMPKTVWYAGTENRDTSITCPVCGKTSWNHHDVTEGYCGHCHYWTSWK